MAATYPPGPDPMMATSKTLIVKFNFIIPKNKNVNWI